jgi:pimeloyl-ACP methyl ester carboxylesterase
MLRLSILFTALLGATLVAGTASAATPQPTYGVQLQGFEYPYPLQHFDFTSQGKSLQMGYMDVDASGKANGRTVVLMHGKNFCAATWESSIKALSDAGYRVVAPDQIGFCTSTKPENYQYTFQQLAHNTHQLLKSIGVESASVLGHSTGGMLATRYALQYPGQTHALAMVNPIGLEDWKALGVPYRTVDEWFEEEQKVSAEGIRNYQLKAFYAGRWKPEYDRWVDMLAGLNRGPGHTLVAWNSALIYDMIVNQPVIHEFKDLKVPTLLLIGDADVTSMASASTPPDVAAQLGNYKQLGKQATQLIPNATLVEFAGLGHAPQMEEPARFHHALLEWLAKN